MLVLAQGEQLQVLAQPQVEAQLGQIHVGPGQVIVPVLNIAQRGLNDPLLPGDVERHHGVGWMRQCAHGQRPYTQHVHAGKHSTTTSRGRLSL